MNSPSHSDVSARPRQIDVDRLSVPIKLLDLAKKRIEENIGIDNGYWDVLEADWELLEIALNELHRLLGDVEVAS